MRLDERVARRRATRRSHGTGRQAILSPSTTWPTGPPRVLADGEVVELGRGKRVRYIDTPHIPHGWDAGVLYEESAGTLLCGDLFTQLGNGSAVTSGDIVGPAIAAEDIFRASSLNPGMGATIRGPRGAGSRARSP